MPRELPLQKESQGRDWNLMERHGNLISERDRRSVISLSHEGSRWNQREKKEKEKKLK